MNHHDNPIDMTGPEFAINQALKNVIVGRCDQHCIAWARAEASLWGMSSSHDLDEPVKLSAPVSVRLRYIEPCHIIADRELKFKSERAGTHIAVRFYFKDGTFHEVDLIGVPHLNLGETAHMRTS